MVVRPLATARTNLPFKSVAFISSGVSNLESQGSVSSQSSNDDPSKEDSDCLSEDPFNKSSSHIISSNDDRSGTEIRNGLLLDESSSKTKFPLSQRFSLDCEHVSSGEKEVNNGITNSLLLHRQRLSLDSETREMSESPTGKSSSVTKGKIKLDS